MRETRTTNHATTTVVISLFAFVACSDGVFDVATVTSVSTVIQVDQAGSQRLGPSYDLSDAEKITGDGLRFYVFEF